MSAGLLLLSRSTLSRILWATSWVS